MDYILICPSHRRAKTFLYKTYSLLCATNAPKPIVWVNDEIDHIEYYKLFQEHNIHLEIRVGGNSIAEKRNLIQQAFPLGTKIVSIDDDIQKIVVLESDNKVKQLVDFNCFVSEAFRLCEEQNTTLWGVYPVANPFFLKKKIRTNLCYIVAAFYGFINNNVEVDLSYCEDFERSLKYYLQEKKLLRFECVGILTKYYKEKGGLQTTRTEESNKRDKEELATRYHTLCRTVLKRNRKEISFFRTKEPLLDYEPTNIL